MEINGRSILRIVFVLIAALIAFYVLVASHATTDVGKLDAGAILALCVAIVV